MNTRGYKARVFVFSCDTVLAEYQIFMGNGTQVLMIFGWLAWEPTQLMSLFEAEIRRPCHLSHGQSVHSSFGKGISQPEVGWLLSNSYNADGTPVMATQRTYTTSEQ